MCRASLLCIPLTMRVKSGTHPLLGVSRSRTYRPWGPPARLKQPIRAVLTRLGYELVRLQRPHSRFLQQLLQERGINLLLDVGANQGQYAIRMRALGYGDRLYSFEPGSEAFRLLSGHARGDPSWKVFKYALGANDHTRPLHVSRDSVSSSLLRVAAPHIQAAPDSVIAHTESVTIHRLDSVLHPQPTDRMWLKLDTQGSEADVLAGAAEALKRVEVVQSEISLLPCYEGQSEYQDIFDVLHSAGFRLVFVEPGTQMPDTGEMLQFDGIFVRSSSRVEVEARDLDAAARTDHAPPTPH